MSDLFSQDVWRLILEYSESCLVFVTKSNIVLKKLGSRKVSQRTFNLLVDLAFNTGTIYNHVLNSIDKNTFDTSVLTG